MTSSILLAEVRFTLAEPAAVGAPERERGDLVVVRPIAYDGWDEPWVPPSSLAGSFRAHLPPERVDVLMGYESTPEDGDDHEDGRSSVVRFLGTELTLPPEKQILTIARTAIDPRRGAAATSTLRLARYLPPGTRVRCWLRVDGAAHHEPVLESLRTWSPILGGGHTTGHGSVEDVTVRYAVIDLNTAEGRRTWLTSGGRELLDKAGTTELPRAETPPEDLLIPSTGWRIVDALHIGSGNRPANGPAGLHRNHERQPYVPGAAWKGLLRSRTCYILRSVGIPACLPPVPADEESSTDLETTDSGRQLCGECDPCAVFGWGGGPQATGARGLLRFLNTPVEKAKEEIRQHVSIDRFTGAAADSLLFSHEVVHTGELELRIPRRADIPATTRAALILALWDVHTGLVGIGSSVTRGYGTLRCTDAQQLQTLREEAQETLAHALA